MLGILKTNFEPVNFRADLPGTPAVQAARQARTALAQGADAADWQALGLGRAVA